MRKPDSLLYGVDDVPPVPVVALNALQHVGVVSINLVFPLIVFRAAGVPLDEAGGLLAGALVVLAIATILQAYRLGPVGSGYLCPATFTAIYVTPSLLAAQAGGLGLVFGMTVFAGVFEIAISGALNRLRPYFPTEVSGLVIFIVGLGGALAGLRILVGPGAAPLTTHEWGVGALTLGVMLVLNVWGTGLLRMLCALIGLAIGYAAASMVGLVEATGGSAEGALPWVAVPAFSSAPFALDAAVALPFAIAAIAATMKAVGTISVCQRMVDADWARPDMRSIRRGVLADGLGSVVSGLAGATGVNTSTPAVGLSAATGVASRRIAYAVAATFLLLGLCPGVANGLAAMPRSVMGAALLFAMSFVIVNGLQVMTSRMLDARRTIVIAAAIIAGVGVEVFPLAADAPRSVAAVAGSSLVLATVVALLLNLVFRIGVRRRVTLPIARETFNAEEVDRFLRKQGAAWGARPEIIAKAAFGVNQLVEAVFENCWKAGPLRIDATFDEYHLDIRLAYTGDLLPFPSARPAESDILEADDGVRLLAGYLLRQNADRVGSERRGERCIIRFRFDH